MRWEIKSIFFLDMTFQRSDFERKTEWGSDVLTFTRHLGTPKLTFGSFMSARNSISGEEQQDWNLPCSDKFQHTWDRSTPPRLCIFARQLYWRTVSYHFLKKGRIIDDLTDLANRSRKIFKCYSKPLMMKWWLASKNSLRPKKLARRGQSLR